MARATETPPLEFVTVLAIPTVLLRIKEDNMVVTTDKLSATANTHNNSDDGEE